jgi:hypothetical protein
MSSGGGEIHKVVMRYYHDNKKNGVSLKDAWAKHAHMKKGYKAPAVVAPVVRAPPALPARKVRAKKVAKPLINPTQRAMIDKDNPIFKKAANDVREALKKDFTPAQLKKMDDDFNSMLAKQEKSKTQTQKDNEWSEFLSKKRLETKPKPVSEPEPEPYSNIKSIKLPYFTGAEIDRLRKASSKMTSKWGRMTYLRWNTALAMLSANKPYNSIVGDKTDESIIRIINDFRKKFDLEN